jgi:hypothetical protein
MSNVKRQIWLYWVVKNEEKAFVNFLYQFERQDILNFVLEYYPKTPFCQDWLRNKDELKKCIEFDTKIGLSHWVRSILSCLINLNK